jgi:uncharacterized surface protein with fasciclin (FAS1) repeats
MFSEALAASGVLSTLDSEGPYTVFVPTNEAFEKLPAEVRERYTASGSQLRKLVNGHLPE